ncbi:MAG: cytochrome ubiquinol oxidase subunit I [Denitrovibrio sp.]|nr:MAG: cytochrome ubiquinol oxidase subunit I [Denitrovibrio sp.]
MTTIDFAMVDWSRAQFALTAMYHWLFVPLTLGLSFLCAFYESLYVRTSDEKWKRITRFWMTLFGINFAIGVATGLILEFEFGTNWSNYSWMVGDIFGAPLAIEGIVAFFLEATFFAVMFFGWDRVSKRFHLFSTWMVAIGSNLSALWILVANGWMQNPIGMTFNPDSARFEMSNFMEVLSNPVAISKFTHASTSGFLYASLFVITISSFYLIKKRHIDMAKKSIAVAAIFGLISSGMVALTGDEAAYEAAQVQPMKLAAFEGLYKGEANAPLVALGVLNPSKKPGDDQDPFLFSLKIPGLLSLLANRDSSFVPGIDDLVYGNSSEGIVGANEKIEIGKNAINALADYKSARKSGDVEKAELALADFRENEKYMGFGYLDKPEDTVPPVWLSFYAFHVMVFAGTLLPIMFLLFIFYTMKDKVAEKKWLLNFGVIGLFIGFLASQAGWIVAEVGRQPWAINEFLPVGVATSNLSTGNVQITFFMFLILFTALLIAEVKIMLKQIKIGFEEGH